MPPCHSACVLCANLLLLSHDHTSGGAVAAAASTAVMMLPKSPACKASSLLRLLPTVNVKSGQAQWSCCSRVGELCYVAL